MHILLADDCDNIRNLYLELFHKAGHEVLQAENAEIAYDLYRINKDWVDVVVTDFEMGGGELNGDALIRNLREDGFEKPIKLVTGLCTIPEDCLIGDTDYFPKDAIERVVESIGG